MTEELINVKEVADLMTALTGYHFFEEVYNRAIKGEGKFMWILADYVPMPETEMEHEFRSG